jgi:hypothetical protein
MYLGPTHSKTPPAAEQNVPTRSGSVPATTCSMHPRPIRIQLAELKRQPYYSWCTHDRDGYQEVSLTQHVSSSGLLIKERAFGPASFVYFVAPRDRFPCLLHPLLLSLTTSPLRHCSLTAPHRPSPEASMPAAAITLNNLKVLIRWQLPLPTEPSASDAAAPRTARPTTALHHRVAPPPPPSSSASIQNPTAPLLLYAFGQGWVERLLLRTTDCSVSVLTNDRS